MLAVTKFIIVTTLITVTTFIAVNTSLLFSECMYTCTHALQCRTHTTNTLALRLILDCLSIAFSLFQQQVYNNFGIQKRLRNVAQNIVVRKYHRLSENIKGQYSVLLQKTERSTLGRQTRKVKTVNVRCIFINTDSLLKCAVC